MFKTIRIGREGLVAAVCAALCVAVIAAVSAPLLLRPIEGGSDEARHRLAAAYGWRLGAAAEPQQVVMGAEQDDLSRAYERLQQGQGMSAEPYLGRPVTRHTYEVVNFTSPQPAEMSIFECDGRIIAAHITTADGCIYGLTGEKCPLNTK